MAEAQKVYESILTIQPNDANALHLLGVIAAQTGAYEKAIGLIDRAIKTAPGNAEFYFNRGNALKQLSRLDEAVASYDKAIAIKAGYAEAFHNRGNTLRELRRFDEAILSYDRAIAIEAGYAEAFFNRGNALMEIKRLDDAIASFDKAIALRPNYADAYNNRGNALADLGRLDEAVTSFDKAIEARPDFAQAYNNRGNGLTKLNRLDEAVASYNRAIDLKADYARALNNRGNALRELQRFNEALVSIDEAIVLQRDQADFHANRGIVLTNLRRLNEALESFDKAIALEPDYAEAYWNKSLTLLLSGELEEGWMLHEWRWKWDKFPSQKRSFDRPIWLGNESIKGKTVLLHSEQGLGDAIQFCRYATLVSALGARVILEVNKSLLGLLRGLGGVSQIVEQGQPLPDFDFHCPLLSLPLALKTNLDNIPSPARYLHADQERKSRWQTLLGSKAGPRIGLVWSGSAIHRNDRSRSLTLAGVIAHLPAGYRYICLQQELREVDRPVLEANPRIEFYGDRLTDFADTAALCDLMDLVISVDTSVAHLAGALGKETWILLPYVPDWRWMLDRDDSPWYPSIRLYRQLQPGDWDSALRRVRSDLLDEFGTETNPTA